MKTVSVQYDFFMSTPFCTRTVLDSLRRVVFCAGAVLEELKHCTALKQLSLRCDPWTHLVRVWMCVDVPVMVVTAGSNVTPIRTRVTIRMLQANDRDNMPCAYNHCNVQP